MSSGSELGLANTARPNRHLLRAAAFLLPLALQGCEPPTTFTGSPTFPGGARGCFERCQQQGMDMSTFVYVGDYSTACACRPRTLPGATSNKEASEGAVVAAAAGVEVQRRRNEEEARRQSQRAIQPPH